jgi:SAM-dependent methyltransferase
VLDAGGTLNHAHLLDRLVPRIGELTIATLEPNARADQRYSYVVADLCDLPFRDGRFDSIACLSTIEHVGMDNAVYGVDGGPAPDPNAGARRAAAELRRVLVPGGTLLVTVPYGKGGLEGWARQFERADLDALAEAIEPAELSITVYRYSRDGWQISDLGEAAGARFRERPWPEPEPDLAAAARAVACVRMTL